MLLQSVFTAPVSFDSDGQKIALQYIQFQVELDNQVYYSAIMEKKYYHDLVHWDDLPRIVKDKPFEADFTIAMYDEPDGAEIPGSGYRVRILPDIYWETERYPDSRAYLVESTAGVDRRFILTSVSTHQCIYIRPEDIEEEAFETAVALAGGPDLPDFR